MRSHAPHHPRRAADLRRHRPRQAALPRSATAESVKTSDLVLAVVGVAMLGGLCLALASNLFSF